ncbi:hypothetical protein LEN26_002338 [Aphanomyces euteiches]|nr:hypothetical protein AeMF1_005884 [Aphanomyces euteiches]KAH9159440.1 hypothetical protein LEN26_002338 [Aphanomyces euteiches]KAH9187388.1 hypothetical protein AeNC1_010634 [Aphanomyces euteiches]
MTSPFVELLGSTLVTKDAEKKEVSTETHLKGKVVGIYFSAHWCPPCRRFTPVLSKYYTMMQEKQTPFEVVFISWDNNQEEFDEYFGEMPWTAIPYASRDIQETLNKKYNVESIPTFILLDEFGQVINRNARKKVEKDPTGADFPYQPKTFAQLLGNNFLQGETGSATVDALANKHLGLYFSASWCGPCQNFTPLLAEAYESAKQAGHAFEIVFVSGDESKEDFEKYFKKMPWLALPFEAARAAYDDLSDKFGVDSIPHLVILGPDDSRPVITADAVGGVRKDKTDFPWLPKPVVDLSEGISASGFSINSKPSLIVFYETLAAEKQVEINGVLESLSVQAKTVCTGNVCTFVDEPSVIFFTNKEKESDMADQIHRFLGLAPPVNHPHAVLLDIPSRQYYLHQGALEESDLRQLIGQFQANALTWKKLGEP